MIGGGIKAILLPNEAKIGFLLRVHEVKGRGLNSRIHEDSKLRK